jgi:SAM-dependent methyltransferase
MGQLYGQKPKYGVSAHYLGKDGEKYFNRQDALGVLSARWNLAIWMKYIDAEDYILDFGCGSGALLSILPGRVKTGIEINPLAQQYARSSGLNIYSSLDDLQDQQFSKIISSHALEHIPNPYRLLCDLRELLDPSGKLLLLVPLDDWRTTHNRKYAPGEINHHLYTWTPQSIGNLLEDTEYQSIKVSIITDAMPPNPTITKFILRANLLRKILGRLTAIIYLRRQLFVTATK